MKIRYILLHAYGMGGTIRTVTTQANSMAAAGHDVELASVVRTRDEPSFPIDPRVRVVTLVDRRSSAQQQSARYPIGRLRRWHTERRAKRPGRIVPRSEYAADTFTRYVEDAVADYIRSVDDGVLLTTRPALNILAARYARSSVLKVGQEHANLASKREGVREATRHWYPRLDALVTLTYRDREDYQRFLPGLPVFSIPNAVHSLDQKPADHSSKIVVAAGRLSGGKGFDLLIPAFAEAVKRHPDWQLRIYGSGDHEPMLRELIYRLHLYNHVFLMGRTPTLDDELAKSSLFVLSSRFEGMPMVMIEAMTHALPVVSFDCPTGPRDVLTDGVDGLLVPPQNIDALSQAMQKLMGDASLRRQLGEAARKTAKAYGPEAIGAQWEALLKDLSASH
jgi:glycosyltransferase involved in cell wall biosynthesis